MSSKSRTPVEHHRQKVEAAWDKKGKLEDHHQALEDLREKHAGAQARARKAARRLSQLAEEQRRLSPAAYEGEPEAIAELSAIEAESDRLTREEALAKEATRHYARLTQEEEERLEGSLKEQARARFKALGHQRYEAEVEAEEAMTTLLEKLGEVRDIHARQASIAANDLHDQTPASRPPDRIIVSWLTNRLSRTLGLPTHAEFSKPLTELDSYASKGDS